MSTGPKIFFWNFQDDRLGSARISICSIGHCYEAAVVRAVHQSQMLFNCLKDCHLSRTELSEVVEEHVATEAPRSWPCDDFVLFHVGNLGVMQVGSDEVVSGGRLATDIE